MLFTGKEEPKNIEGFDPIVQNDLPIVTATGGQKFLFYLLVVLTLGLLLIIRITRKNLLNKMQVKINEAASGIDIQLEKRYDTLTKLVDAVKGHTRFNKEVYENIAAFRSGVDPYAAKNGVTAGQPTLQDNMALANSINQKQGYINRIYGGLAMQFEQYPTLGADASIAKLMNESTMIEKEIAAARRLYNSNVTGFNELIYSWPTNVIICKQNYQGMPLFIASETKKTDVKVSF